MRKFALLAVLAAALAAPSIAFADTAQGRMTGFGTVGPTNIPFGPWLALSGLEIMLIGPWLASVLPPPLGWLLLGSGAAS